MHRLFRLLAPAALLFATATTALAAKHDEMEYGRFLAHTFDNAEGKNTLTGKGGTANKAIAIKLGAGGEKNASEAAMLFDTDLCRMAGGWTGGWIKMRGVAFDGGHGPNPKPADEAKIVFETNPGPGWSRGEDFADPRKLPTGPGAAKVPFGPLPREWAQFKGHYAHGDHVVLAYTVGGAQLLELPALEKVGDAWLLTRTINVLGPGAAALLNVAEGPEGATASVEQGIGVLANDPKNPDARLAIGVLGAGAQVVVQNARLAVKFPAFAIGQRFKVVLWKGPAADLAKFSTALKNLSVAQDLKPLTQGGPARWPQSIETKGTRGADDQAYTVDTLTLPFENPSKAWMRLGGLDFFQDGTRAAVSTWSGDVWIVSGIDDSLAKLTWRRFASGLFQALGLKIVDEKIYVLGRDQITRLHDMNGDGEADLYECFNNDVQVTPGFHEFAFDLQTDPQGNFYFAKGGPVNPGGGGWGPLSDHSGCIFKVSRDGGKLEIFATGVRAPNGISVGPNGEVTTGDNEGTWVPKCYLHVAKAGDFITVADLAHRADKPTDYGRHVCFMPKDVDNSGGGQVWVTSDRWGMAKGRLLHFSYGTCSLLPVLMENVGGTLQGGVYRMPVKFESGTMRPRFNPRDGQLYVAGLKGWQSSAAKDGCLQRVRFTGKSACLPDALRVTDRGLHLGFTAPLDRALAASADSYAIEQFNYRWTQSYGSDERKVSDPAQKGRDVVDIKSVQVSADGRSVFLEIPGLTPVMQMRIQLALKGADGRDVPKEILNTINVVGPDAAPAAAR